MLVSVTKPSDYSVPPQATDPDVGANGQVGYRIINHPDLFVISANGSIYTKVPLDRELRSQYDLVVEASDGAVDPRRTTMTLSIQVKDIDDSSPVFSQQNYMVNVPENTPVGTVILKLNVSRNVRMFACVFMSHVCFHFISRAQGTAVPLLTHVWLESQVVWELTTAGSV